MGHIFCRGTKGARSTGLARMVVKRVKARGLSIGVKAFIVALGDRELGCKVELVAGKDEYQILEIEKTRSRRRAEEKRSFCIILARLLLAITMARGGHRRKAFSCTNIDPRIAGMTESKFGRVAARVNLP